jgi:hypothetical protein
MALYNLLDRIRLRKTLASPAGILLIPGILFVTFFALLAVCTFGIAGSDFDRFREVWERLAAVGTTLAGVGTFFIALTLGASFLTLAAQSEQLTLQKRELEESRAELIKAAEIQAKTLGLLEAESRASMLTAKIQSLNTRLRGYEEQIGMIRARNAYSMSPESRTESDPHVSRMRSEQDTLYRQLDRILDDLKIGTKAEIPPEGTYSDPLGSN